MAHGISQTVVQVVVDDGEDSRAYVVDEDGIVMPTKEFWKKERATREQRFGRMTPALFKRQAALDSADSIEVDLMIYSDVPEPERPYDGTDLAVPIEEFEAWITDHANAQEQRIANAKAGVLAVLSNNGAFLIENARGLPTITARVSVELLRSTGLNAADVVRIDLRATEGADLLGYAGRAGMDSSEGSGGLVGGVCGGACNGGGIDVGIWEGNEAPPDISGLARNNTRISTGNVVTGYQFCPKTCNADTDCADIQLIDGSFIRRRCKPPTMGAQSVCVQDHLTWVAASIGMFGAYNYLTTVPSIADPEPNVFPACGGPPPSRPCFLSTGAYDADIRVANNSGTSGLDFLITSGPQFPNVPCQEASAPPTPYINRSQANTTDVINWPGRALGTFVTAASGNKGNVMDHAVECARLKNGLCVGMLDYRTYHDQSTHVRASLSSFKNDTDFDPMLERPHLLGPGNHSGLSSGLHMPSIDIAPGGSQMRHASHDDPPTPITGTSFSSPAILSVAIQAHQFEGWFSALAFPMVNKAVLLAATRDGNNDGAVGKANVWSQNAPSVDAEDGAGQIRFSRVQAILENNRYFTADLADSVFISCGTGCRKFIVTSLTIPQNTKTRIALAWQSCMIEEGDLPILNNDLDLALNCGSPIVACGGTTLSNTVPSELEMLERPGCAFEKTCTIEIRIKNGAPLASCGSTTTERVGIAWSFNN